jgi:hypothetical protein
MQNEEPHPDQTLPGDLAPEQPPTEPPPTEPGAPETPPVEHDAVSAGGKCSTCGWEFGSPDPHEVNITADSIHTPIEGTVAPPEPPAPPEPDPNACAPIPLQGKCSKCGWSIDDPDPEVRSKPHPTY